MSSEATTLKQPYSGYYRTVIPAEDPTLTHSGPGTPCGEYFRKAWQPVALSADLIGNRPFALRLLGEDLVLFRDLSGRLGLLHRHCSHRGTSLEFGIVAERGIRCCYHGWLYDIDGTILETPGEPARSRIKDQLCHGAYPALEYRGLVFAYLGPPEAKPAFPVFDTYGRAGNEMIPYSLWHPCNWLQIHENMMDPIHAVFLHTRVAGTQLTEAWGEMPEVDYRETGGGRTKGMMYVCSRRCGDNIWIRSNHTQFPSFGQTAALWEDGSEVKLFSRVSITRWTVPLDDTHCLVLGWRHFNDEVDPQGRGDRAQVGKDSVDFVGQTGNRSYQERQDNPGDWDAQVSQRPIAIHAMENLGASDRGVAMFRRLLNREISAPSDAPVTPEIAAGPLPTYSHDTVLAIPAQPGSDDRALLRDVARRVTDIILESDHLDGAARQEWIEDRLSRISAEAAQGLTAASRAAL